MASKKKPRRAAVSNASKKKTKAASTHKRSGKSRATALEPRVPEPARLQAALRDSIEHEIAGRIEAHQREVALIEARVRRDGQKPPLMLLAHGDSWFNYPCDGNTYTWPICTDIIVHLEKMGSPHPKILNISHYGDATTDEMGLDKQKRLIAALTNSKNWLNGKPDGVLFSGGGNDIAGDPFIIYLDYKDSSANGLDATRFAGRLASIEASYLDLLLFRDRYAPQVPIFGHGYDNARPMRAHPPCIGPWMKPSINYAGWTDEEGRAILYDALTRFRKKLDDLENDPKKYDFTRVHTEGALADSDCANELHPHPKGFEKLARRFLDALHTRFPGRI
jgi:hypothetical protein